MSKLTNEILAEKYMAFFTTLYATVKQSHEPQGCLKAYSRGFYVLFTLKFHPHSHLTLTQLAKELSMTKQQLTKLVNDLEEKQLVKRVQNPSNRRSTILEITETGKSVFQSIVDETKHTLMLKLDIYTTKEKEQLFECMKVFEQLLQKAQLHANKKETLHPQG